jgi:hypothetical protein
MALPTSTGDTPGGAPMALAASERSIVGCVPGGSGVVSAPAALGALVVQAGACFRRGTEALATALPGTGGLEAGS